MKLTQDVIVLGPGCAGCESLAKNTKQALKDLNYVDTTFNYITDITVMASLGIMSAPALMVKGKVVSTGKVLTVGEIKNLLRENDL